MTMLDPPSDIVQSHIWIPQGNMFLNAQPGSALVLHSTAGWQGATELDIANMFVHATDGRSAHFVVGRTGGVCQCVPLQHGAGANCCVEQGYDPFWSQFHPMFVGGSGTNLNTITISIEHVMWTDDNSDGLTDAQKNASWKLIDWIVHQYGFDVSGDGRGQMKEIKGHYSLDPGDRARCPGNFPWNDLVQHLSGGQVSDTSEQALQNEWNSTASLFSDGKAPRWPTGISASWEAATRNNPDSRPGPPISNEYNTVTWQNGKQIVAQEFAHARCEWDGTAHWYR